MSLTHSLSVELVRGTRRFQRFVTLGGVKPSGEPPRPRGVFDPGLLRAAIPHAFRKLDPRLLIKNPVMFVVEITAVLVTITAIANVTGVQSAAGLGFHRDRRHPLLRKKDDVCTEHTGDGSRRADGGDA